jgi:hypothetical protein
MLQQHAGNFLDPHLVDVNDLAIVVVQARRLQQLVVVGVNSIAPSYVCWQALLCGGRCGECG